MEKILLFNLFRPFPGFLGPFGSIVFGTKVMDLVIIILLLYRSKGLIRVRYLILALLSAALLCLIIWSGAIFHEFQYTVLGGSFIWELLKIPFYGILGMLILVNSKTYNHQMDEAYIIRYTRYFLIFALIMVFLRLSPIREFSDLIWSSDKFKTHGSFLRVFPLTPNPNWSGALTSFFLLFYLFEVKHKSILIIFLFFILIVLSGSRTALVGLIYITIISLRWKYIFVYFMMLLPLLIFWDNFSAVLPEHFDQLVAFGTLGFKIAAIPSLEARFDLWIDILFLLKENWVFGLGPMNDIVGVTDNQYLKWILYYGVFGLILQIIFFAYLLIYIPIYKMKSNKRMCIHMFILLLVFSLVGAFYEYTQLIITTMLLQSISGQHNKSKVV